MPHKNLDGSNIYSFFKKVGSKGVPKRVEGNIFSNSRFFFSRLKYQMRCCPGKLFFRFLIGKELKREPIHLPVRV